SQANATFFPSGEMLGRKALPGRLVRGTMVGTGVGARRPARNTAATHRAAATPTPMSQRVREVRRSGTTGERLSGSPGISRTAGATGTGRISKVGTYRP